MKHRLLAVSVFALCAMAVTPVWSQPAPLVGFDFDEGSGDSVMDLTGTYTGFFGIPPTEGSVVELGAGPSGDAADTAGVFNGIGALIDVDADPAIYDITEGPITMEAWVFPNAFDETWIDIFRYGGTYKMGFNSGNMLFTLLGVADVFGEVAVPVGEWSHLAMVWEPGAFVVFYLNGEEVNVVELTGTGRAPVNSNFVVGGSEGGSRFNGSIDRVRVHNAVLEAADLDSVADAPKPALDSTIVHLDFDALPATNGIAANPLTLVNQDDIQVANSFPEWSTDSPTGTDGDNSLFFNGIGSRVIVDDPEALFQLDLDLIFTLEAYVKYDELPQNRSIIFAYGVPGTGGYSFSVRQDPRTPFVTTYGILDAANEAPIPNDGQWHHLAVVHDEPAGELRFYVDGELGDTLEYFGGVNFAEEQNQLMIGVEQLLGSTAAVLPYEGYIDRIRIHTAVLDPSEFDIVEVVSVGDWMVH